MSFFSILPTALFSGSGESLAGRTFGQRQVGPGAAPGGAVQTPPPPVGPISVPGDYVGTVRSKTKRVYIDTAPPPTVVDPAAPLPEYVAAPLPGYVAAPPPGYVAAATAPVQPPGYIPQAPTVAAPTGVAAASAFENVAPLLMAVALGAYLLLRKR